MEYYQKSALIRRGRTDRHHPFKMGYVGSSPAAGTIRRVGRTARHLPCKKDDGISEFSPGSRLARDVTVALKVLILSERVRIFPGQPFERIRSRGVKPAVPEGTRKKIWGRDPPLGNEIPNSRRKLFGASKEVSVGPDPFFFLNCLWVGIALSMRRSVQQGEIRLKGRFRPWLPEKPSRFDRVWRNGSRSRLWDHGPMEGLSATRATYSDTRRFDSCWFHP